MSLDPERMTLFRDAATFLIALILSICVHEYGHAIVADLLGDPLPRAQGRVTLNPLAHIDPLGTLLFPVIGFFMMASGATVGLLGWGKPVRVSLSARSITRKITVRTAHLLIAIAGPLMNVLFALVLSGAYVALLKYGSVKTLQLMKPLQIVLNLNIMLFFFNLIPCPPLDGGAVLRGILPRSLDYINDALEKYGFVIFFALLATGALKIVLAPAYAVTGWWITLLHGWAR